MNNHRITIRTHGAPVGTPPAVLTIKENEITSETGLTCYEAVQRLVDQTYSDFCRNADLVARETGEIQFVEYEMIDTQSPVGTSTHIRPVRSYQS